MKQSFFFLFFFFFFYITMYMTFPSRLKELCTVDCVDCLIFHPDHHHTGECYPLYCFGSNQKVLYKKPKEWGRHGNIGLG